MVTDYTRSYGGYCIHEYEWTATEEVNEPHESPTSSKDTCLLSVSPDMSGNISLKLPSLFLFYVKKNPSKKLATRYHSRARRLFIIYLGSG